MANITINDELKELKYTNGSITKLEKELDQSIFSILSDETNLMGIYNATLLLWCGLLHQEPRLTINKAGMYLDSYLEQEDASYLGLFQLMIEKLQENKVIKNMTEAKEEDLGN